MGITTINLYTPELFGKVSPLNKNAFSYYRFKLDACFVEEGQMINKIRVIPKKDDNRLLEGDLFMKGRIRLGTIGWSVLKVIWNKNVKITIARLKKISGGN